MKNILIAGAICLSPGLLAAKCSATDHETVSHNTIQQEQHSVSQADNTRVQVALLLDTSNSMDGLIDQAKSRLWNIINTLSTLKYKGKAPILEIALYEYGNDGLPAETGHIRQVTPMTTDLDLISEKLFSLRTNGGSEYCGAVIREAVTKLDWGSNESDMKLIYIAGNEPFDQGRVSYRESVSDAWHHSIFVNTIFCGDRQEGIRSSWKDGADRGKGKYFNIDSDRKVRFVATPYDQQIDACNVRLNKTYISYGTAGAAKKRNQEAQDNNARSLSAANYAERAVSKSKSHYSNAGWDIVDKYKDDKSALKKLRAEDMPGELKGKSEAEQEAFVAAKIKERAMVQAEIAALAKQREAYISAERSKSGKDDDDLGTAINSSLLEFAKAKGYISGN